ncbi:MAG: hypothetical protein U0401_24660 [Anaerolineae bacterium]
MSAIWRNLAGVSEDYLLAPSLSGSANRIFILLALIKFVGLICIGVLGLAAALSICGSLTGAQQEVVVAPTPVVAVPATPTFTLTQFHPHPQYPEPASATLVVPRGQEARPKSAHALRRRI